MHVLDKDRNIVKKICYNYAGQTVKCYDQQFLNDVDWSANISKNDCAPGETGSSVFFSVPVGSVASYLNIGDANAKAFQKRISEGQAYANANGNCSILPPTIYASISVENMSANALSTFGDVVIRFYSDMARTQPISVSNLFVRVQRTTSNYRDGSSSSDEVSGYANGFAYVILSGEEIYFNDGWTTETGKDFILLPESGYTIN